MSPGMHGEAMLADGPYRRTRNPLYLGTILHTLGLAILMPPSGALFCIAAVWLLQVRLALAEEPFLDAAVRRGVCGVSQGSAAVSAGADARRWQRRGSSRSGCRDSSARFYFVGVVIVFAVFGWNFNVDADDSRRADFAGRVDYCEGFVAEAEERLVRPEAKAAI